MLRAEQLPSIPGEIERPTLSKADTQFGLAMQADNSCVLPRFELDGSGFVSSCYVGLRGFVNDSSQVASGENVEADIPVFSSGCIERPKPPDCTDRNDDVLILVVAGMLSAQAGGQAEGSQKRFRTAKTASACRTNALGAERFRPRNRGPPSKTVLVVNI